MSHHSIYPAGPRVPGQADGDPPGPIAADVTITDHAVARYVARVKPSADLASARRELEALRAHATVLVAAPDWVHEASGRRFFLAIGTDMILPLAGGSTGAWFATTCLVRGSISSSERRRRRARRTTVRSGR